jgi:superfamily II DNA or RNA helicase
VPEPEKDKSANRGNPSKIFAGLIMTQLELVSPPATITKAGFELRDYQLQAISQIYRLIRSGIRSALLVAPTGAGKTCIGSRIVNDAVTRGR